MGQLEESDTNLEIAQRAIERALRECVLDERLRCIHNARRSLTQAWKLLVEHKGIDGEALADQFDKDG